MTKYPTRGVELFVPSNADIAVLSGGMGVNFSRRGHDYEVRFYASGITISRDGVKVRRWDDLSDSIQDIIIKAKHNFVDAA